MLLTLMVVTLTLETMRLISETTTGIAKLLSIPIPSDNDVLIGGGGHLLGLTETGNNHNPVLFAFLQNTGINLGL